MWKSSVTLSGLGVAVAAGVLGAALRRRGGVAGLVEARKLVELILGVADLGRAVLPTDEVVNWDFDVVAEQQPLVDDD